MAKTTPVEFIQQVRAEARKVSWPSRRQTVTTGIMVMIMTLILAIFFFVVDSGFDQLVKLLLGLATK